MTGLVVHNKNSIKYLVLLFWFGGIVWACDASKHHKKTLKNEYPADIAFCIVDLKFDGKKVKICEFGNGITSHFEGYESLYGKEAIFKKLLNVLSHHSKNIVFYKTDRMDKYHETLIKVHTDLHGEVVQNLSDITWQQYAEHGISAANKQNMSKYQGLIVPFVKDFSSSMKLKAFKKTCPWGLFLDEVTYSFLINKFETDKVFSGDAFLEQFRPKYKLYPRKYSDVLAKSIINDLGCQTFVIKPINGSKGHGVIIVDKGDLADTIKMITKDLSELDKYEDDPTYSYWRKRKDKTFYVEEYVPSKQIVVRGKPYDATMRVVFVLSNDKGHSQIDFLDAYWKLPSKALGEVGSLTDLHKSHIAVDRPSSAKVSKRDHKKATRILKPVLLHMYNKMLTIKYGQISKQEVTKSV